MSIKFPANVKNYAVGRTCGTGTIRGIVLVEVNQDAASILQGMKQCAVIAKNGGTPPCGASYNYVFDPQANKLYETVDVANTPFSFDQTNSTCKIPAASPVLVGEAVGTSPNCTVVTVAIATPQQTAFGQDCALTCDAYNVALRGMITEVLTAAQVITPALTDANVYTFLSQALAATGTDRGTIGCETLVNILNTVIVPPAIINPLCLQISQLPAGTPTSIVGKDAAGDCVLGPFNPDPCPQLKAFPVMVAPQIASYYIGIDSADTCVRIPAVNKYSADHNFVALVPLVVSHNLNLSDPLAYVMTVREALGVGGGDDFAVQVIAATANSITLVSNTAQTAVRVTIIG